MFRCVSDLRDNTILLNVLRTVAMADTRLNSMEGRLVHLLRRTVTEMERKIEQMRRNNMRASEVKEARRARPDSPPRARTPAKARSASRRPADLLLDFLQRLDGLRPDGPDEDRCGRKDWSWVDRYSGCCEGRHHDDQDQGGRGGGPRNGERSISVECYCNSKTSLSSWTFVRWTKT